MINVNHVVHHEDLEEGEDPFAVCRGVKYRTDFQNNIHTGVINGHLQSGELVVCPFTINSGCQPDWSHSLRVKRLNVIQTWAW